MGYCGEYGGGGSDVGGAFSVEETTRVAVDVVGLVIIMV